MTDALAGNREPISGSLKIICVFAEIDAKRSITSFCGELDVSAFPMKGLARQKDDLVGVLCP